MRTGRLAVVWVIATTLVCYACAKGGTAADDTTGDDVADDSADDAADDSGDDSTPMPDAPDVDVADARPPPDARVDAFIPPPPDAFVPPPDAAVTNPLVCDANSDCVEPDTCCFLLVCVPGVAIGSACFPS